MRYLLFIILAAAAGVGYSKHKNDPVIKADRESMCGIALPEGVRIEYSQKHNTYVLAIGKEYLSDYGSSGFLTTSWVSMHGLFEDSCYAKKRYQDYVKSENQ